MLVERLLQRRQLAVRGETLDRRDPGAVRLHRQKHAALHGLAVEVHRARPAVTRVAADVRAGEPEIVPDEVHEEATRLDLHLDLLAVDLDRDRTARRRRRHYAPFLRLAAWRTARAAEISARRRR
jgi:hypothetical protein